MPDICRIFARLGLYVRALIDFHAERFCYIFFASEESGRDQHKISVYCVLAARDLCHIHPAGLFIFLALQLDKHGFAEFTFLVFYELFDRCLVHTRIMSEHSDRFLLAVVCLADSRPLRPRVCLCSLIRSFRHHLQLKHRLCPMPDRSSDTVVPRISAADDDHIFSFRRNVCSVFKLHIVRPECFRRRLQEIYCKIDSLCIPPRSFDITGMRRSAGKDDAVILF